jgi:hypothetical protein
MKPENSNFLQPTKFVLTFAELPDTVYFCQQANIPGVKLGEALQSTPNLDLFHSGTKLQYSTFDITFLVNEDLAAWTTIYNWMKELSSVEASYIERRATRKQATLTVMSNLNNPKMRVKYVNVWPTSITDLQFDTTLSADSHMTASATFRYDYFEIENID